MLRKRTPLLSLLLIVAAAINARADQLDDYIKAEMEKQHIPGLSMAVVRDGKVIRAQGYGLANVNSTSPPNPRQSIESVQSASSSSQVALCCSSRRAKSLSTTRSASTLKEFVDDKLTVIILTNSDQARPEGIARGVAAFYISDLVKTATPAR